MKHYGALFLISCSDAPFGMVIEDDVSIGSALEFKRMLVDVESVMPDFIDVAGGAGLDIDNTDNLCNSIIQMSPLALELQQLILFQDNLHLIFVRSFAPWSCQLTGIFKC